VIAQGRQDGWDHIRAWSQQRGRDPWDLNPQEQQDALAQHSGLTLDHSRTRERTKQGYRNMLWNQVLPVLGNRVPGAVGQRRVALLPGLEHWIEPLWVAALVLPCLMLSRDQ